MNLDIPQDEFYMRMALNEAHDAFDENEVPVGAVIVLNNQIISRGHNLTETLNDVTAHAEMMAITAAANHLGAKYLKDCALYVTLEPCIMCAGAINHAQISRIIYGTDDPKKGYTLLKSPVFSKKVEVKRGVLQEECAQILKDFFKKRR